MKLRLIPSFSLSLQAVVSNQRLKEFLVADELRPEDIDRLEMLDDGEEEIRHQRSKIS